MDVPVSDDSEVANHSPSEMSDLTGDFNRKTGMPMWGSGESISGDAQFSDMAVPRTVRSWRVYICRWYR